MRIVRSPYNGPFVPHDSFPGVYYVAREHFGPFALHDAHVLAWDAQRSRVQPLHNAHVHAWRAQRTSANQSPREILAACGLPYLSKGREYPNTVTVTRETYELASLGVKAAQRKIEAKKREVRRRLGEGGSNAFEIVDDVIQEKGLCAKK